MQHMYNLPQAVRCVLDGVVERALAVVRPPGHHAECERAMGFCFFNNVVVAVREAMQRPGERAACAGPAPF